MLLCVANLCHLCPWAPKKNKEEEDGQWIRLGEEGYSLEGVHGLPQRELFHTTWWPWESPNRLGHFDPKH